MGVWAEARIQAARDTLELARLNEPFRAVITLGVPLATVAGVWVVSGQLALAALIGLLALFTLALGMFLVKLIGNVAGIAERARKELATRAADDERAEMERRDEVVAKLGDLYLLERGGQGAAAIKAGLELPPEDWLNEHLAERGEVWHICGTHNAYYYTFEVVEGDWRYRGHRMRSPAAIRWAAFFDALGIDWKLGSDRWDPEHGTSPDFYLPELNAWFLVELLPDKKKAAGYAEIARATSMALIVAAGGPVYAKENLLLFRDDGSIGPIGGRKLTWAEDRRDDGVYWLTDVDGSAAVCIGGPGKQTGHDRAPLLTERLKAAFDSARRHEIDFKGAGGYA